MDRDNPAGTAVLVLSIVAIAFLLYEVATGQQLLGLSSDVPFALLMLAAAAAFYGQYGLDRPAMSAAIGLLVLGAVVTLVTLVVGPPIAGALGEVLVLGGIALYLYDTVIAS